MSILAIKVFDRWRRRDTPHKQLRLEYAARLREQGIPYSGSLPEDLQVRASDAHAAVCLRKAVSVAQATLWTPRSPVCLVAHLGSRTG